MLFNLATTLLLTLPGFHEPWGKNSDLHYPVEQESTVSAPLSLLSRVAELVIQFHQKVISPVDGPRSHFKPSSSQFMLAAIRKHGFFQGYIMGCDRLLRENSDPWIYRTAYIDGALWKLDPPR
jgi:uncharacterized protein